MREFIKTVLERPVGVVVCVVALIIFGLSSLNGMSLEREPETTSPYLCVSASYEGVGPEEMERLVTRKLEAACTTLKGFREISTTSMAGNSSVFIDYDYGVDLEDAKSELQDAMIAAKAGLPQGVEPEVMQFNENDSPIMTISVESQEDTDVRSFVKQKIEPELKKLTGVADLSISGGVDRYISIEVRPDAMAQYNLNVSSIADTISSAAIVAPAGEVLYGDQKINISSVVNCSDIDDIRRVPIRLDTGDVIHLYDIAQIEYRDKRPDGYSRFNGQDNIMIDVKKKQNANVVDLAQNVRNILDNIQAEHPEIEIRILTDNSIAIKEAIQNIFLTLILGVVLSMLVLLLFFGDFKASMIVGSSMPISLLVTFIMMARMGYTLNLVTMSALVIGIGMMVDNSIVVLEMCFRKKEEGLGFREAALEGTRLVVTDVIASTLTSVVVYLPLVNLKGETGQRFGPLGWTIMFSLTASLFSALTLVPLAFSRYRPVEKKDLAVNRILDRAGDRYAKLLPRLLKHKFIVAAISLALVGGSVYLFRMFMVNTYGGQNEDPAVTISLTFKPGTSLETADEVARHFEEFVKASSDIEDYQTKVRGESVDILAFVPEDSKKTREEITAEWNQELKHYDPRCDISVSVGFSWGGGSGGIEIPISANNYDELKAALQQVEELALKTEGVISVKNELHGGGFKAEVKLDPEMILSRGFSSTKTISGMISDQLQGKKAVDVVVDDRTFEAIVELPGELRSDIRSVEAMTFKNTDGTYVPFSDLAHIEYTNVPQMIQTNNGKYRGTITATVPGDEAFSIQTQIENAVRSLNLPKGVALEETKGEAATRAAVSETSVAIAAAVFLVFMVMAIQFESLRYSLLVMFCIPFSLIGAVPLLYAGLPDKVINLSTLVGLLMLGGIVVNDGIMYVDTTNEYRKTMSVEEALTLAGKSRLRPILMTTMTTVLSMVPMVIPGAGGDPSMRGLAYVIIGGLGMATILTLIILPVFYLFACKKDPKTSQPDDTEKKEPAKLPELQEISLD